MAISNQCPSVSFQIVYLDGALLASQGGGPHTEEPRLIGLARHDQELPFCHHSRPLRGGLRDVHHAAAQPQRHQEEVKGVHDVIHHCDLRFLFTPIHPLPPYLPFKCGDGARPVSKHALRPHHTSMSLSLSLSLCHKLCHCVTNFVTSQIFQACMIPCPLVD